MTDKTLNLDTFDEADSAAGDTDDSVGKQADNQPDKASPGGLRGAARALFDWVLVVGIAIVVAMLVKTFLLAHFIVDGESMSATLHQNDRVFVNKLSYRLHEPSRGDVVVLHEITGSLERDLIKRVIALPGETIAITNCDVFIDGQLLIEPYLSEEVLSSQSWCEYPAETVPDEHVFVLGDNRPASSDSRRLGPIAYDDLVGRAFVVFWPTDDAKWL